MAELRAKVEAWAEGAGIASRIKGYDALTRARFDGECRAYDRVLAALPEVLAEGRALLDKLDILRFKDGAQNIIPGGMTLQLRNSTLAKGKNHERVHVIIMEASDE